MNAKPDDVLSCMERLVERWHVIKKEAAAKSAVPEWFPRLKRWYAERYRYLDAAFLQSLKDSPKHRGSYQQLHKFYRYKDFD